MRHEGFCLGIFGFITTCNYKFNQPSGIEVKLLVETAFFLTIFFDKNDFLIFNFFRMILIKVVSQVVRSSASPGYLLLLLLW